MPAKRGTAAPKITLDQLVEATFNAVSRANQARRFPGGHIICGIIWDPSVPRGTVLAAGQQ